MTIAKLEQRLLEKLDAGLLDGVCGKDIKWSGDNAICRRMIVGGIPYYKYVGYIPTDITPHGKIVEMDLIFEIDQ